MAVSSFGAVRTANVTFVHPSLAALMGEYKLIRDAVAGETAVKAEKTTYLPQPDPTNKSDENTQRYKDYLTRAVFYNVSRRTLAGLVGQIFAKDPVIELPKELELLEANVNGAGVTLTQQAKKALKTVVAFSRAGLFADYPTTENDEGVTVAQAQSGEIRPYVKLYSPLNIINWRMTENGGEEKLSLVVIAESYVSSDDGFEIKNSCQFRVLRLTDGVYTQEIWREPFPTKYNNKTVPSGKNFARFGEVITPTGPDGKTLDEIPFTFVGTDNNDPLPDLPNFYDLASLNIAHYRNSADYEDSCFIVGQPTPVVSGLTQDWLDDVLKGVIKFGSRGGIPLPKDAKAELLQATENTMIKEAMEIKERQMVALGAKLVEQKQVQRTAAETKIEATSEGSILASATLNVQSAYAWILSKAAMYANANDAAIKFELNTDFDIMNMTPEERRQTIEEWQKGAITFSEMRNVLKRGGSATEEDDVAKTAIDKEQADAMAAAAAAMESAGDLGSGGENDD